MYTPKILCAIAFLLLLSLVCQAQPGGGEPPIDPTSNLDLTFNPTDKGLIGANNMVNAVTVQPDGKILIGGRFTMYGGKNRKGIVRLNADGSVDNSFNPGTGFQTEAAFHLVVETIVLQPDGKILVGGDFNGYNGQAVKSIVRLNADGSLDPSFQIGFDIDNSGASTSVRSIQVQSDGKIIIGGWFKRFQDKPLNIYDYSNIARLNANGSLDASFNPGKGFSGIVNEVILRPDGKILVGGLFTTYKTTNVNNLVLLNENATLNSSFSITTTFSNRINSMKLLSDGKIVAGGDFRTINGVTSNCLARFNADGTLDQTFNVNLGAGPANGSVYGVTLLADGKIGVAGFFTTFNGASKKYIAVVNADGSLDNTFIVGNGFNYIANKIARQIDDKLLVVGEFTSYRGVTRERIARLQADGSLDLSFNTPDANHLDAGAPYEGPVHSIVVQPDNKIVVGGTFTSFKGEAVNGLIRFNEDGSRDNSFQAATTVMVKELVLQPDGKIVFIARDAHKIYRLNADGSIDNSFNTGTGFDFGVYSLALQPDGKILVGGYFSSYNGQGAEKLIRLNTDGSVDADFNVGTGFDQEIEEIVIQPDGKILVGGTFTTVNGQSRRRIARLLNTGALDNSFTVGTGFNDRVFALALQEDGKILAGGAFDSYQGTNANYLIRLHADGSIDNDFNTGESFNTLVYKIAVKNGNIFIGGNFTSYNETPQGYFTCLNLNGAINTSFDTGTGFDNTILTIAFSEESLYAGGYFYSYRATPRSHIVRLYNIQCDVPTNLTATAISHDKIQLDWSVAEDAAEYTIEYSTNNQDFSFLIQTVETNSFTDQSLLPGTLYYYRVRASSENCLSAPSNVAQAQTLKVQQTITFGELSPVTHFDPSFQLTATASSGLTVNYTSSDESVATVSGKIVTIVGPGETQITASQAGNAQYNAAENVIQTLVVNALVCDAPQNLSAVAPYYHQVNLTWMAVAGASSYQIERSTGDNLNFVLIDTSPNALYQNNGMTAGTLNYYRVKAVSGNCISDPSAEVSVTMPRAEQEIQFDPIPEKSIEDEPFELSAFIHSGLPISFSSSNEEVATVAGNIVTIVGSGETEITASQGGNELFEPAEDVTQTLVVHDVITALPEKVSNVAIYPNPGYGVYQLKTGNATCSPEIRLTSMLGTDQFVKINYQTSEVVYFDINHLPSGTYFVHVKSCSKTVTQKIIKR